MVKYTAPRLLWNNHGSLAIGLGSVVRDKLGWKPAQIVKLTVDTEAGTVTLEPIKNGGEKTAI